MYSPKRKEKIPTYCKTFCTYLSISFQPVSVPLWLFVRVLGFYFLCCFFLLVVCCLFHKSHLRPISHFSLWCLCAVHNINPKARNRVSSPPTLRSISAEICIKSQRTKDFEFCWIRSLESRIPMYIFALSLYTVTYLGISPVTVSHQPVLTFPNSGLGCMYFYWIEGCYFKCAQVLWLSSTLRDSIKIPSSSDCL